VETGRAEPLYRMETKREAAGGIITGALPAAGLGNPIRSHLSSSRVSSGWIHGLPPRVLNPTPLRLRTAELVGDTWMVAGVVLGTVVAL